MNEQTSQERKCLPDTLACQKHKKQSKFGTFTKCPQNNCHDFGTLISHNKWQHVQ